MRITASMAFIRMTIAKNARRLAMLREAERHHTDLNLFAVVASLMEGGFLYTTSGQRTGQKIIRLCRREEQVQLKAYDKATAKAKPTTAA